MDVIEKQLDYLNETMKETAAEANSFLLKYHFGGLVAVLALLNIDLVLIDAIAIESVFDFCLLGLSIFLVIFLSRKYFAYVLDHYGRFTKSHRKLKYKYELTLHAALSRARDQDYQFFLEQDVNHIPDEKIDGQLKVPNQDDYEFIYLANYLLNHHRIRYKDLEKKDGHYLDMAMAVIILTLAIRAIFLIIGS